MSALSVLIIKEMHIITEYVITSYYIRHSLHNFEVRGCKYHACLSLCKRHAVALMVEALYYKPEGRGFDS